MAEEQLRRGRTRGPGRRGGEGQHRRRGKDQGEESTGPGETTPPPVESFQAVLPLRHPRRRNGSRLRRLRLRTVAFEPTVEPRTEIALFPRRAAQKRPEQTLQTSRIGKILAPGGKDENEVLHRQVLLHADVVAGGPQVVDEVEQRLGLDR